MGCLPKEVTGDKRGKGWMREKEEEGGRGRESEDLLGEELLAGWGRSRQGEARCPIFSWERKCRGLDFD